MPNVQQLAQQILGYGQSASKKFADENRVFIENQKRYSPQVAMGAQLAGGDSPTVARSAYNFLQQRNLPGQGIADTVANYTENSPTKQAAISAYRGTQLTPEQQRLLMDNALSMAMGLSEPIKKVSSPIATNALNLLKNKTTGAIQAESQTKRGLPLLAEFDKVMSKGQTDEGLKVARQILDDPKYKDYHKAIGSVTKLDTPKPPTDPLEALKVEARKYWHGTTAENVIELKPGGLKGSRGENTIPGISITDDFDTASYYARKNGIQVNSPIELSFNGKLLEVKDVAEAKSALGLKDWSDASRSKIPKLLADKGYDGIKIKSSGDVGEVVVTNPKALNQSQLPKSKPRTGKLQN